MVKEVVFYRRGRIKNILFTHGFIMLAKNSIYNHFLYDGVSINVILSISACYCLLVYFTNCIYFHEGH